jgi:REP element-mobilizing transposase RayT
MGVPIGACAALAGLVHFVMYSDPLAYFLTFRTFGTWHPGDERGSVNRVNNVYGERGIARNPRLSHWSQQIQNDDTFVLDAAGRSVVDAAIRDACRFRGWKLIALNVRTNHVHAVVWPDAGKDAMMTVFKARATRVLREAGVIGAETRVWSRHGSTRVLFCERSVTGARYYVLHGQGAALPNDDTWWEHYAALAEANPHD